MEVQDECSEADAEQTRIYHCDNVEVRFDFVDTLMNSQVFRGKTARIFLATASSLILFGVWFAHANKDGCWIFWHGAGTAVAVYSVIWIWFALFLFFRLRGRITLA